MESMEPLQLKPLHIFFSYADEDENYATELKKRLMPLQMKGYISFFDKDDIPAGQELQKTIETHLNSADIILLLISPDFMASDYCYRKEMPRALQRRHLKQADVIPIILSPALWEETPIGSLRVLPKDRKPISTWDNRDAAFHSVAKGVEKRVKDLLHIEIGDDLSDPPAMPPLPKLSSEGSIKFNPYEHQIQVNRSTSAKINNPENTVVNINRLRRVRDAKDALRMMKSLQNESAYKAECARWMKKAEEARKHEEWEEEQICWEVLQDFKGYTAQALERWKVARQNQEYKHLYDEAKQHYKNGDTNAAKAKLKELWGKKAPFYGDPAGLGRRPGIRLFVPLGGWRREVWINLLLIGIVLLIEPVAVLIVASNTTHISDGLASFSWLLAILAIIMLIAFIYLTNRWIYLKLASTGTTTTTTTTSPRVNPARTNPPRNKPKNR